MRIFCLSLLYLLYNQVNAQINPPDFNCIEGNGSELEIFWTPPLSTCGTLMGYEVFYADQIDGPYQSLIINDPSVLDTTIATALDPVYCFIKSVMNCPGQPVLNSDTLIWDLSPPNVSSVSVNSSNNITVSWEASASPDIAAYLVYVNGGNIPDTVWGGTSENYIDLNSDPTNNIHNYEIAWFRDCVNDGDRRGSIGATYHSILLENLQQDKCNKTFSFGWNAYENYEAGVSGYSIDVSINNGIYNAVDTVPNDQLVYLFQDAENGNHYCFRVSALLPNGEMAHSNAVCDSASVVDSPRGAHLRNATVTNNNTIHVEYFPDTAGIIDDLNFQRSLDGLEYENWPANLLGNSMTIPSFDTYEDIGSNPSSRSYSYRFRRTDECDSESFVAAVNTIHLKAELGSSRRAPFGYDLLAELEWTPFMITDGAVQTYHIIKYVNGDSSLLASVSGDITYFEDFEALNSTSLDTVCYQIIAEIDLDIENFVTTSTVSQSNINCLQPVPKIVAANLFKPYAVVFMNRTFKPIIFFGTEEAYTFRIYDRWNRMVFETNNPAIGWDGLIDNGKVAPMDVYVYYVSFLAQDGATYSKSGTVAIVR